MSTASTPSEQESDESEEAVAAPETTPALPIVQFSSKKPQLRAFYSLEDALRAAQASPKDRFVDVRGNVLTPPKQGRSALRLDARAQADPDDLKQRMLSAVRNAAASETPGRSVSAEDEAFLRWVERAPTLVDAVFVLAPVRPPDQPNSKECWRCSKHQKRVFGTPPCCPG